MKKITGFISLLDEYIKDHPIFKTIKSQAVDKTRAKGREIMEAILKSTKAEGKKKYALVVRQLIKRIIPKNLDIT